MKITLEQVSKKFSREWIFKNVDYIFESGNSYAITGGNGSGKSTFIKLLAGINDPSKGKIEYFLEDKQILVDDIWKYLVLTGPYTDLIEEYTLVEHLNFHRNLKNMTKSNDEIIEVLGFKTSKTKQIRDFSSGMKQKFKLALAFFTETEIIFLDEPTSNLDHKNIEWYQHWLPICSEGKIVIICSNQPYEYKFCSERILIENYKY